jgi:ubiquinone/menaquinone biosynthesis C-methylase UbiE
VQRRKELDLKELQRNWVGFARTDPLRAILTVPDKENGEWDDAEFFKSGVIEINRTMNHILALGIPLSMERAIDFGCGVGRLTQALCRYFDECCGIDISPSMVEQATKYNRYADRCTYVVNETTALPDFEDESCDFIFSTIVLQHMIPQYSVNYIREFLRILRPGGVLLFQLPAGLIPSLSGVTGGDTTVASDSNPILPDIAFRAEIKPHIGSLVAKPASRVNFLVTVKNLSPVTWPSPKELGNCILGVGTRWLNEKGEIVIDDDARSSLDWSLRPNEKRALLLECTTPPEPGRYILELDMVQDLVSWFALKGSEVVRLDAQITRHPTAVRRSSDSPSPLQMEMYGVPKEQILDVIGKAGGRVVDVRSELDAGPEWESYLYCVVKE